MARRQDSDRPTVHVLTRKEELDPARIAGKTLIVVDILFATTSIIAALDGGVPAVYPARDADEARGIARRPELESPLTAGEAMFRFIDGFARPTPLALRACVSGHDALVYATTNGTVALRACAGARRVMVGALINAGATIQALDEHRTGTVIVMCAGTAGAFNLEDFYGAGCLVDGLARRYPDSRLTDAAMAARGCFLSSNAEETLKRSYVGGLMHQWDLDDEVAFAARIDSSTVAAEMQDDRVIVVPAV